LPATPLTAETVSVSPSASLSFDSTSPLPDAFSVTPSVSFTASGAGFDTFHVNVCCVVAPEASVAVTVTL